MSSSRTPSSARSPRFASSFAHCFGATTPVSPPRPPGLAGRASGINYHRLGFDDFEADEPADQHEVYWCRHTEPQLEQINSEDSFLRRGPRGGATLKLGKHSSSFREKQARLAQEAVYASEGEQERKGVWKLGKERAARGGRLSALKESLHVCADLEEEEYIAESTAKQAKGRTRGQRLRKREKAMMKEEVYAVDAEEQSSPRRASFGARMKEACVHALETARRGSPHLSELFVGNMLLMQVTSSSFNKRQAKHRVPSYGFHEFTGDASFSTIMISSPANSTSSHAL